MQVKLTETEIKTALDFWMRQSHPTMMEGKEILKMVVEAYPARVTFDVEKPDSDAVEGPEPYEGYPK